MKILVDAMSGDNAPLEIIKGASMAAQAYPEHQLVLVGDENVISDVAVKNDIDMGEQPDGLGNDFLINICDWTRTNSTA